MNRYQPFIAIVDDDESIRKSFKRLLVSSGFHVEIFASGPEFLVSLETRRPDALVLDIYMPDLNGLDVQARLATSGSRIPIIFITAHDDPALRAKALGGGAAAYLDKPVCKDILLAALYEALAPSCPGSSGKN